MAYETEPPVWTLENINRRQGDTTFEQCGWCAHADCGSVRYDCHIETKCALLGRWSEKVYWNTPCKIKGLGKSDLASLVEGRRREAAEARWSADQADERAATLLGLAATADDSPVLPHNRGAKHFNLGDTVLHYRDDLNTWRRGTVVDGYRHHDGCVSFCSDRETREPGEARHCGYAVPTIMRLDEARYFAAHPAKLRDWLDRSDRSYNGTKFDMDALYDSFPDAEAL